MVSICCRALDRACALKVFGAACEEDGCCAYLEIA